MSTMLKAKIALGESIEALEKNVKTMGISKDANVVDLARECFTQLKQSMESRSGLNKLSVITVVASVEVFFEPTFAIVRDLKKYQDDPQTPVQLVWCDLCNTERALNQGILIKNT